MPTRTPLRPTPPPPARRRIDALRLHLAGAGARIRPLATRARGGLASRIGVARRAARRFWRNDVASVPWSGLLAAVGILLLGGWAADAAKGDPVFTWIPWAAAYPVATAGLLVGLLVVAIWQVFLQRRRLISVGTLVQGRVEPHAALILPLSPAKADVTPLDGGGVRVQGVRMEKDVRVPYGEPVPLSGLDLEADVRALDKLGVWPWQQLLRAVHPHRGVLGHVVLLGSSGEGGSFADLQRARTLLEPYLPGVVIHPREGEPARPVDFDDVRELLDAFHHTVRALTAEHDPRTGRRIRQSDVVVDITGGLKPTSVAGALATLSSAVTFQYVHTLPERGFEVRGYDLLHRGGGEI